MDSTQLYQINRLRMFVSHQIETYKPLTTHYIQYLCLLSPVLIVALYHFHRTLKHRLILKICDSPQPLLRPYWKYLHLHQWHWANNAIDLIKWYRDLYISLKCVAMHPHHKELVYPQLMFPYQDGESIHAHSHESLIP